MKLCCVFLFFKNDPTRCTAFFLSLLSGVFCLFGGAVERRCEMSRKIEIRYLSFFGKGVADPNVFENPGILHCRTFVDPFS